MTHSDHMLTKSSIVCADTQGGIDAVASFSSSGPTYDGRIKPDVVAPGYYVISAEASMAETTAETCAVTAMAGTSMVR